MVQVFFHDEMDWLQVTLSKVGVKPEIEGITWLKEETIKGVYTTQCRSEIEGLTLKWNYQEARMGTLLSAGGSALSLMRERGITSGYLINLMLQLGAKNFPRVDLRKDVWGAGSVWRLMQHVDRGEYKSRAKPSIDINDRRKPHRRGRSLYFGSETSDLRSRIYDKAALLGYPEFPLMRIEMQFRNAYAVRIINTISESTIPIATTSAIKAFLDFPKSTVWQRAMKAETVEIPPLPRNEPATVKWLRKSVLPAIKGMQERGENLEFIEWFRGEIDINP